MALDTNSIKVKTSTVEDGYTYVEEFFSTGVCPKSVELGIQILKKALSSLEPVPTEMRKLLSYKG